MEDINRKLLNGRIRYWQIAIANINGRIIKDKNSNLLRRRDSFKKTLKFLLNLKYVRNRNPIPVRDKLISDYKEGEENATK